MLVSGALSLPVKGRWFQRLPAVLVESGAVFRKNDCFTREGSKKHKTHARIPRFFVSVELEKSFQSMHPSRSPARVW